MTVVSFKPYNVIPTIICAYGGYIFTSVDNYEHGGTPTEVKTVHSITDIEDNEYRGTPTEVKTVHSITDIEDNEYRGTPEGIPHPDSATER